MDIIRFDYGTGESDEEGEGDDEGGEGGGGETGGEEKKLFNCFEDTTTKVADSGRKEMNPCSHACEEQRSGTKNFAARAAPPYFHFPSVMICLTRASERARGLAKSGACRKEGRKASKQAELGADCRQKQSGCSGVSPSHTNQTSHSLNAHTLHMIQ